MTPPPVVEIDPDGTLPEYMFVLVERETGVWYEHQYGGTANQQGRIQGFLVPVQSAEARAALNAIFLTKLKGTGLYGGARRPDEVILQEVRDAVALVRYWTAETGPQPLTLDDDRAAQVDEAWVPVRTADGPGILLWPNSD